MENVKMPDTDILGWTFDNIWFPKKANNNNEKREKMHHNAQKPLEMKDENILLKINSVKMPNNNIYVG